MEGARLVPHVDDAFAHLDRIAREADVRTVLAPNPDWWDKSEHNLTEAVFSRIANDATRIAALLSVVVALTPADEVVMVWEYSTDLYARDTILRMVDHFHALLAGLAYFTALGWAAQPGDDLRTPPEAPAKTEAGAGAGS